MMTKMGKKIMKALVQHARVISGLGKKIEL